MRRVEGNILTLRCRACGAAFSTFVFSGDTDMATEGLAAVTSRGGDTIVIGELTAEEWRDEAAGHERFAQRVSRERRAAFCAVPLLRMEGGKSAAPGATFQEFCRDYVPPEPLYCCPKCAGESAIILRPSIADFAAGGGSLVFIGDLTLESG